MPNISTQFSLELGHADNLNKAGRRFLPCKQKHGKRGAVAGMEETSRYSTTATHTRPPDGKSTLCKSTFNSYCLFCS